MSDETNPFSSAAAARPPGSSRLGWVVAAIAGALAILFLVFWYDALEKQHGLEGLRGKLDAANAGLNAALAENQKLKDAADALQKQVADLEQEKAVAAQMSKGLEDEMRADLESKDVTISKLQGKLTVNILDRVLFSSGEAVVQPSGESVLRKIAALLVAHPNLKIHVIGHTDNVPFRGGGHFASNWELSTARALAAVHFLTERAGVDPRRVGAVGYGEFRPVADNATAEGRAKNRRIAVTILPDEIAAADTAPAAHPVLPANLPPGGTLPAALPVK
jgi:chemotaxis protein MotB